MSKQMYSYKEAIQYLQDLVRAFEENIEKKNTFLKRGVSSQEIDRELERLLNEIQWITGDRSIRHAKNIINQG
ncbi:hypothetical protein [Virgibacillus halodenitrificans]|uniref:hypothetical protein n=1 Tax=Virgibacillus halodenitrificans TaxID=1482 RepID=UPI000EF4D284|nr:hypothetical protein [Virgibacillus halodenitrificans]